MLGLAETQLPEPSHFGAAVNCEGLAEQEALPQLVLAACCWQPLAPSQRPVLPQVAPAAHWPAGAVWPAAIAAQVPLPLSAHDWQVPQPLLWQQTPSLQKPLLHSWPDPQGVASAFLGMQVPFTLEVQKSPLIQSLSRVQLVLQLVAPHT